MDDFSYDSAHFVNLQIFLDLLPVGNHFSISTQIEVSLQKNHKNTVSGHPYHNQLSVILHLLLLQEYDMDAMFSQIQILQLIGLSLGKVITLPVMLPSTNGSNQLIETLVKRLNKLRQFTCKGLQSTCCFSYGFLHLHYNKL